MGSPSFSKPCSLPFFLASVRRPRTKNRATFSGGIRQYTITCVSTVWNTSSKITQHILWHRTPRGLAIKIPNRRHWTHNTHVDQPPSTNVTSTAVGIPTPCSANIHKLETLSTSFAGGVAKRTIRTTCKYSTNRVGGCGGYGRNNVFTVVPYHHA